MTIKTRFNVNVASVPVPICDACQQHMTTLRFAVWQYGLKDYHKRRARILK